MTLAEIVEVLHSGGVTTTPATSKPPNAIIADLLGYQVRSGRVMRVRRGVYAAVPSAFSATTKWRCLHWRDGLAGLDEF